jgi:hypothetical protein
MATGTAAWQRRMAATGVMAAAVITPILAAPPAIAASLCAPPADTVPPQISEVTFSTQAVDVSTGPRTVTVTADATDTSGQGSASGVKRIIMFISGPGGGASAELSLASGTAADGVWTGKVTIPKTARTGTWVLREVEARDFEGNSQDYDSFNKTPQSPSDIRLQPGWDQSIAVTGATPPPPPKPVKAGTLTGFDFTPQSVDTTKAAKTVHVSATFSGLKPIVAGVFFDKTSGRGHGFEARANLKHATGDRWTGHVRIPSWVGDTKARPQLFAEYAQNARPRNRNLNPQELHARHFPSVLTITSGVDKTKPTLKTLSFSPASVNTTTGAQTVTVTATASDALSGVARVNVNLGISHGDAGSAPIVGLYPFPGLGFQQTGFVNATLTPSGSKWVGTLTFRKCVPSGNWHTQLSLSDNAGNFANYPSKTLTAAGLPGTLAVTSTAGDVEPPTVRDATASGADGTVTLDFTEGVKNVSASTLSVYALRPVATRYQHTTAISAIVCSNGKADVACSGSGGLVTSAILTVPAVVGGKEFQVFANLGGIGSQLTDGAGNPLSWNFQAADVTGS